MEKSKVVPITKKAAKLADVSDALEQALKKAYKIDTRREWLSAMVLHVTSILIAAMVLLSFIK